MKRTHLSAAIAVACYMSMGIALAQTANDQTQNTQSSTSTPAYQRVNPSSTSNTTTSNATQRDVQQLSTVTVQGQALSLGGGLMSVQTAPKAVSTITREAIEKAAPGSNFTQLIATIPGVNAATDDVTGLADGHYSIRGYDASDIGVTVNGAPVTDTGSYSVFATEYGDSENMGDITVLQGIPDIDMPDSGASGGHIAWATIDPSHQASVDVSQTFGSFDYRREFVRLETGDTGPVRSWISFSDNTANLWRNGGQLNVKKVDAKSIWTINDDNTVTASLQYNRERNNEYETVSKAAVAENGYFTGYNTQWIPLTGLKGSALTSAADADENYTGLHVNPFRNYVFSLDGEFKITDSLHLSVIPYWEYDQGGGGDGAVATETTSLEDRYLYTNTDLNGDGQVVNNSKGVVYSFETHLSYRPGVIFKFNQDLGMDNSLEYGFWYERSRESQADPFSYVDPATGSPANVWGDSNYLLYPTTGVIQSQWDDYTTTELKKVFVTDNWTPNDQWTFTAGFSYLWANMTGFSGNFLGSTTGSDTQNLTYFNDSWHKPLPAAGIKFQLDERNQFYIGTGKTFRVPENLDPIFDVTAGTQNQDPEESWNTDLGWRYYGDAISASADLYHSNYFNKQEEAFSPDGDEYFTTIHRMDMSGFNGEASWKFIQNWTVYSSYTYTRSKIEGNLDGGLGNQNNDTLYDEGVPAIYLTNGKMMPDTPRNIGNVSLSYDDSHFWASLNGRVTSKLYGDYMNTESVPGFTTFSFNAGYRFGDFDWLKKPYLKLNISNLTNRRAFTYVSSPALLASSAAARYPDLYANTVYYGLEEPRAYMLTIGASFQ